MQTSNVMSITKISPRLTQSFTVTHMHVPSLFRSPATSNQHSKHVNQLAHACVHPTGAGERGEIALPSFNCYLRYELITREEIFFKDLISADGSGSNLVAEID